MCNFFSCIVTKDGRGLWLEDSNNHSHILEHYKIPDNTYDTEELEFARVEIVPPYKTDNYFSPVHDWNFRLDERITPKWWNENYKEIGYRAAEEWVEKHVIQNKTINIIQDKNKLYLKGCKITDIVNCVINQLVECAVGSIYDTKMELLYQCEVSFMSGCRAFTVNSSNIQRVEKSAIELVKETKICMVDEDTAVTIRRIAGRAVVKWVSANGNSYITTADGVTRKAFPSVAE